MKTIKTKITNSKYPEDYKEVFNHYLLKKAIIDKFNKDEPGKIKNKKHD